MNAARVSNAVLLAASLAVALPASASDAFLKIQGAPGASMDMKHAAWIEVDSLQLHEIRAAADRAVRSKGGRKVQPQDIPFIHLVDKASPILAKAAQTGRRFPVVTLEVRKAGGSRNEFLVIVLHDVIVTGYRAGAGPGGASTKTDSFTLSFREGTFENLAEPTPTPGIRHAPLAPGAASDAKR